ncbi:MAG: hypothetical protein JWO68_3116, partial [Actinomycetia bacterium]|nr:hypothetical protein [Actinomycetes bacterium]
GDGAGGSPADVVASRFDALIRSVGLPTTLSGFGVRGEDVAALARRVVDDFANKQRTARVWAEHEILELLEAAA